MDAFLLLSSADVSIGICIYPEGDPATNASDPITLGQAKPLVDKMVNYGCTVCGQIPLHYLDENVTDARNGGFLRADYRANDNCIDKCIGPWSYKGNSTSIIATTTTSTTSTSSSKSAAKRLAAPSLFKGGIAEWFLILLPVMVAFTSASVMFFWVWI